MKFLARGEMAFKDRRYLKQGALVYITAKLAAMLAFIYMVDCSACADTKFFLIRGLIHVAIFSHFIFIGLLMAVRILVWISFFRTWVFIVNILINKQVFITFPFTSFKIELLSFAPFGGSVFLIPAIANGIICYILVRALVKGRDLKKKPSKDGIDRACPFKRHDKDKPVLPGSGGDHKKAGVEV